MYRDCHRQPESRKGNPFEDSGSSSLTASARKSSKRSRGVLSVRGEDGCPCGMPINFLYEDGKLCLHGAEQGAGTDALKKDNRVSFCVYDEGTLEAGKLCLKIESVILFGRITIVEDPAKREEMTGKIGRRAARRFSSGSLTFSLPGIVMHGIPHG